LWAREPEQIRNIEFRFLLWGEDGLMVAKDDSAFFGGWKSVKEGQEYD
jgi:hypothetical protein